MMLGGTLERLPPRDERPQFLHKGGVSLEMRLKLRARATQDFDTTFRGTRDELFLALDTAFETPYHDFSFRRMPSITHETKRMVRIDIKVEFRGRSWATVPMEISAVDPLDPEPELVEAISLSDFGLAGPTHLPCIPIEVQIAHKLHGATESVDGRRNDRVNDLVDLVLLCAVCDATPGLRDACERTFLVRETTAWPPTVIVQSHWPPLYERLAADNSVSPTAAALINAYIGQIAAA
jgi:Nucleotidyl transferase AbiEii toxin, Type IV TA system